VYAWQPHDKLVDLVFTEAAPMPQPFNWRDLSAVAIVCIPLFLVALGLAIKGVMSGMPWLLLLPAGVAAVPWLVARCTRVK